MTVRRPYFKTGVHSSMPELNMCQTIMNLKPPRFLFQHINCICSYPELRLIIYPNPAKEEINVSMNSGVLGEGTVSSAYDVTGRRMVRYVPESGRQKAILNSSGWSSGIYIITVQRSNGALTTGKVTIAR